MKYSYAIFDMDGLMFDTENLFVTSFETEVSCGNSSRVLLAFTPMSFLSCSRSKR